MVGLTLREELWNELVVPSSVLFLEEARKPLQKIRSSKGERHA